MSSGPIASAASTHRAVWRIAGPMILSNLSIPLLGMVDTAVVGHLPHPQYLGAVAVGTTLFNFLYLGLNFLRMGTTGVTAQIHGSGDTEAMRGALGQGLLLALILACVLLVLQWPLRELGLWLIGPSAGVSGYARVYFDYRIWAAPAVLADYVLLGWFLGMQNARAPLVLLLVVNVANIALDFLFVFGLGMNVDGVGLATVIAEYLGLSVALWLVARELRHYPGRWRRAQVLDGTRLRHLIGINANIFARTICVLFAFGFFTAQGARMGDVVLAANALLLNMQSFMAYGLDGLAHAAEALVGRAVGAHDARGFRDAVRATLLWSLGVGMLFAATYGVFGGAIIHLLTNLPRVRDTAHEYLPWMILSPLISVWAFLYDGVYIGSTRAREMRNTMLVAVLACYLPAWYLTRGLGNHGLWLSLMVFIAARGATMAVTYVWIQRHRGFVHARA